MYMHPQHLVQRDESIKLGIAQRTNSISAHGQRQQCHLKQYSMHRSEFQRWYNPLGPIIRSTRRNIVFQLLKFDQEEMRPNHQRGHEVEHDDDE